LEDWLTLQFAFHGKVHRPFLGLGSDSQRVLVTLFQTVIANGVFGQDYPHLERVIGQFEATPWTIDGVPRPQQRTLDRSHP